MEDRHAKKTRNLKRTLIYGACFRICALRTYLRHRTVHHPRARAALFYTHYSDKYAHRQTVFSWALIEGRNGLYEGMQIENNNNQQMDAVVSFTARHCWTAS